MLSCTDQKPDVHDLLKLKFEGVRYIDENGILVNGMQTGNEKKPTGIGNILSGLEGIPMDDCDSTRAIDLFPMDVFNDPSLLFSGPSRTGFTRIGNQDPSGSHHSHFDLSQFFGGGSEKFTASCRDIGAQGHEPEHA